MGKISRNFGVICLLSLLGWGVSVHGQQYVFQSYHQAEGLENIATSGVAFDHEGFVWVSTENGLFRFLGSRFERYGKEQGLPERMIRDVFVDVAGRVWAVTYENLYRWNGRRFEPLDKNPTPVWGAKRVASPDAQRLLVIRRRELVEFTLDSAGRVVSSRAMYTAKDVASKPDLKSPTSVFAAPGGTVWMGCGYRICSIGPGGVKVWGAGEGVPALAEQQEFWLQFLVDRKGSLWAVSSRHLLELKRGAQRFVDRGEAGFELTGNALLSPILEDGQGRILRATDDGLARWDGSRWERFTELNGLPSEVPYTSLAMDGNGDPWIGGSGGLHHWEGYGRWEGWTRKDGLPDDSIWSFAWRDPEHLLIGTEKGPAQLDIAGREVAPLFHQHALTGKGATREWHYGQVSGIGEDRSGQVWASTWTGNVIRIPSGGKEPVLAGDIHWLIFSQQSTPDGGLLLLSKNGIYRVDHPEAGLPGQEVRQVQEVTALLGERKHVYTSCRTANGDLWFLAENGLLRLNAGKWSRSDVHGFNFEGVALDGLGCDRDGSLWIDGLDKEHDPAIWHLKPTTGSGETFEATRLPLPGFLQRLQVHSLLADRRGWLWVGTDVGLVAWNGSEWRHFVQENGLIWNDTNQGVLSEGPDGSIWVGTSGGVAHLLHPETVFQPVALSVTINSIARGSQVFLSGETIRLPWSRAPIQFAFSSPPGRDERVTAFRYRIAGLNSAWIDTPEREVAFPSLPPGKYSFEVFALNPEIGTSSAVASVAFEILSPWWRSWWFLCLCGVGVGLLLWLLLWLRTRTLLVRQHRLEELISERTRELELSREELRVQATRDALTGLYNRRAILGLLDQEMDRARREGTLLAVLLVDLDYFKRVNDTYGHMAGDATLRRFAEELGKCTRTYDQVGRYGGEEFLLLVGSLSVESAEERLGSIHACLTNLRVQIEGREIVITCSVGACFLDPHDPVSDANLLLSGADKALYEAKRAGRNCVVQTGKNGAGEMTMVAVKR